MEPGTEMGRRGDELSEHILWTAMEVFLEAGFERASMDVVATRAGASKRTLYAHFESKENLFLAIIELVRGLILEKLRFPGESSQEPAEALTTFCARYLRLLRYEPAIQMCRVSVAEAARFPQGAVRHFDAVFAEVDSRVSAFLQTTYGLTGSVGDEESSRLLGRLLYPRLLRALYGIDDLTKSFDPESPVPAVELASIRKAVDDTIESIQRRQRL